MPSSPAPSASPPRCLWETGHRPGVAKSQPGPGCILVARNCISSAFFDFRTRHPASGTGLAILPAAVLFGPPVAGPAGIPRRSCSGVSRINYHNLRGRNKLLLDLLATGRPIELTVRVGDRNLVGPYFVRMGAQQCAPNRPAASQISCSAPLAGGKFTARDVPDGPPGLSELPPERRRKSSRSRLIS